jgi:hypothetical protein
MLLDLVLSSPAMQALADYIHSKASQGYQNYACATTCSLLYPAISHIGCTNTELYTDSQGLLFGVYSDTGNHTCEGYPGSWGHEEQVSKASLPSVISLKHCSSLGQCQ